MHSRWRTMTAIDRNPRLRRVVGNGKTGRRVANLAKGDHVRPGVRVLLLDVVRKGIAARVVRRPTVVLGDLKGSVARVGPVNRVSRGVRKENGDRADRKAVVPNIVLLMKLPGN